MIAKILGSETAEKVLFYLTAYGEGHASGIAKTFDISLSMAQKQLARLEEAGLLVSSLKGRTRLYLWNPRYLFLKEFKSFLEKAFEYIPEEEKEKYYYQRTRPRRAGKPL